MNNLSKVFVSFTLLATCLTANAQKVKVNGVVTDPSSLTPGLR